jgi:hypothetical protein
MTSRCDHPTLLLRLLQKKDYEKRAVFPTIDLGFEFDLNV